MKKCLCEFLGTFWLVLGGCGTAVLAGSGVGTLGISLAFGLTVLTMAYTVGPVSGAHLNPAVTLGLWAGGRTPGKDVLPYIVAQILGALAAATVLYFISTGNGSSIGDFAANGYGAHSPGGYSLYAALLCEFVMTFIFLMVILSSTAASAPTAGFAIGLCLALIHLISIPVTNTSVNPARSISQAVFVGGWAIEQLWLFILVPSVAALVAGLVYKAIHK